jgi:hypothetical protein
MEGQTEDLSVFIEHINRIQLQNRLLILGLGWAGLSKKAGKRLCHTEKLIQARVIYCLILISDSIMVPCYGRITLNTKGCANSCFFVEKKKKRFFFDISGDFR